MQFRDLPKQYEVLKPQIDAAMVAVASSANFISGPEVKELEKALAAYVGVKHCITCANGTDAITIAMRAWGIGKGDAVFVPDFTFFSSGECPADEGATPIYVDVDSRSYNLDPVKLEAAVKRVISEGKYKAKAVIAVDLFGLPADYYEIKAICEKYNLLLLEDAAQGFGGSIDGKMTCSFGDIATTSFFPAKPLGCYGDGGAIFTDNDEWADLIRSICVHGKDTSNPNDPNAKYNNIRLGKNSRLDTLQAAILLSKFKAFVDYELADVNKVAAWYNEGLKDTGLVLPIAKEGFYSSWAQYTVQLPGVMNTQLIRSNYTEAWTTTTHPEVMQLCMDIPVEKRLNHSLYKKWILSKYPEAAKYKWEKTGGVINENMGLTFVRRVIRRGPNKLKKMMGLTVYNNSGMNPIDYWIANSYELRTFLDTYEESGLKWLPNSISSRFITDLRNLYHSGNASEKAMVLTVLSAAKLYFGEETNGEVCPEN